MLSKNREELEIVMIPEITLTLQPSQVVISPDTMASCEGELAEYV